MSEQVNYIIQLLDRFSGPMRKVAQTSMNAVRSLGRVGSSLKKLGYHFTSLRGIISATYGAAMIAFPIKKAAEFESKMIDVQRVSNFKTPEAFKKFEESLLRMSIHLGKMPAEMGDIAYEAAKLSDSTKGLIEFITLSARASTAFDMAGKDAARMLGKFRGMLGLDNQGTQRFLDAANYISDRYETTGARLLHTTSRMLDEFKQYDNFKLAPELIAGWAAFADSIRTTPRLAASGMRIMMREVAKMPGITNKMLKDPHKAMIWFLERLSKLSLRKRQIVLDRLMSKAGGEFVKNAAASLVQLKKAFGLLERDKFVGSMLKELEKKLTSATTAIQRMKAVFDIVLITIGEGFLPLIKEITPIVLKMAFSVREFVKEHPRLMKIVMGIIALVTALTAATIIIGLVSIAIGTLLSPITLVVLGVMSLVALFAALYFKTASVRREFAYMTSSFDPIIKSIDHILTMLFGGKATVGNLFGGAFSLLGDIVAFTMKGIGDALRFILSPFELGIKIIETLIEAFIKAKNFIESISLAGVGSSLAGMLEASGLSGGLAPGMGNSISAMGAGSNQNTLNGRIEVSASEGSKVNKAEFDNDPSGDVGFYMRNY